MGRIGVASGVEPRHPGSQQITQAAPVPWDFRPALDQRTPTTAHSQLSTTWSGGVGLCFGRCASFAQAKAPKQHLRVRASKSDRLSPTTQGDALAPANRLAYSLSKRTVAQPDATKRPERGCSDGPFLRLGAPRRLLSYNLVRTIT